MITCDLLHESTLKLLHDRPHLAFALPVWLICGKANLKHNLSQRVAIDVKLLPYDQRVLQWVRAERESGRRVVLCTASDAAYAQKVADYLGVFDEVIASDGVTNVSAHRKAELLEQRYGNHGFDYAGNSRQDLRVWEKARRAILVAASPALAAQARRRFDVEREFERPSGGIVTWLGAIRLKQWAKNVLVFLPLAGAHQLLELSLLAEAVRAFVAFGLCASSIYIVNDLIDPRVTASIRASACDRLPPPISPLRGAALALALLVAAYVIALSVTPAFVFWLTAYLGLTLAYTLFLKRRVLADCLALGVLYLLRIVAGWSAVGLPSSFWLLAFSLFLFFVSHFSSGTRN